MAATNMNGGDGRLVVVFFGSRDEAEIAARRLAAWMRSNPLARLRALGVLAKDPDGAVSTRRLGPRGAREGAGIGLLVGIGAALATGGLTLLHGMVLGVAGGGALGVLFHKRVGLTATERRRIGSHLDSDRAAVVAVVPARQAAAVEEKLEEWHGVREQMDAEPAAVPSAA